MKKGVLLVLAANLTWGLLPVYWKALASVPAPLTLAHRVVWSFLLLALLLTAGRRWPALRAKLRDRKTRIGIAASSAIIGLNWLTYLYAMNSGRIVEASLGYFLYPLVTALLGGLFLRERQRPAQEAAIGIAAFGVLVMTLRYGAFPWLSVVLALSFGSYSLLRKTIALDSLEGLAFETGALTLLAAPFLAASGRGSVGAAFGGAPHAAVLLALTGLITAGPLLLFISGSRRLPLTTAGFLNYVSSSLQFLVGVVLYREPFTPARLAGFAFIWAALALYSIDVARAARAAVPAPEAA